MVITIYVIQKSQLSFYKILILIHIQVLAFWMKERRNQCNHNLHLLQSNIITNFYNYWIYFNRAGADLHVQSKFMYFHIFVSLLNIAINRYQSRMKLQSSPSIQICLYYLSVSLNWFNFFLVLIFFFKGAADICNQYFDDIIKFFIICSLKMSLSYLRWLYDCGHIISARKGRGWF